MTEHVLDHEAADPRAGVHRGQDEQRLEQDREVVPECLHRFAAHGLCEDLRHADGQCRRAAGARQDACSRRCRAAVWLIISGVIVKPQLEMTCAAFAAVVPMTADGAFIAK